MLFLSLILRNKLNLLLKNNISNNKFSNPWGSINIPLGSRLKAFESLLNNFFKMIAKICICKNEKIDFFAKEIKYFPTLSTQ